MADEHKEVAKQKITVKNTGKADNILHDASGQPKVVGPGQEVEVEVAEPQAKILQDASKQGSSLTVSGHEPEKEEPSEVEQATPEEHGHRADLAKKEAELMKEGQEGDKERREKDAKKSGFKRAAETGIRTYARGVEPEVVAWPLDLPPEKQEKHENK